MLRTTATSVKEFQDRAGDVRNIKFGDGNCIGLLLHTTQSFTTFCLHKILVHYASCYFGVPFHFSLRKILRTHRNGFTPSSHTIKNTITNAIVFFMGRVMAVTLNLLRLRYKFIFCTRQTTAHSSPCLSWESFPTDKTSFCVGSICPNQHNKKADNKSYQLFYGAGDDSAEKKD